MMELSYYNDEVDKILFDIIGNDSFPESDFDILIDTIANTIHQYDTRLSRSNLKIVVKFLIEKKYQKYYQYAPDSDFNKLGTPNDPNESEDISINVSDFIDSDDSDMITNNYINPELNNETFDKVKLNSAKDLVSHRHNYKHNKFQEECYKYRMARIVEIKAIPQFEQKSDGWFSQRGKCLTATAIATALDEDPYKSPAELLLDKCNRGIPFIENEYVHHGKKYEKIGDMFYSFRNNIELAEYGLIQHEKYSFIGASPDGICEKNICGSNKLSSLVGRLLEIKFPKTRKILTEGKLDGDICPHYYYVQVQTQLFVTNMSECDFLQCKIHEYKTWEEFVSDSNPKIPGLSKKTNLEKGCLIQLLPKNMIGGKDKNMCLYGGSYIYPPRLHMTHDEIKMWIAKEVLEFPRNKLSEKYMIDRVIYWRLAQVSCHLIKAEPEWFESKIPLLKQFWNYVLFYRKNQDSLDKLVKYIEEVGSKTTKEIFERVHEDYKSLKPNTIYNPLYQEENPWRKKINEKNEKFKRFREFRAKNKKPVDV